MIESPTSMYSLGGRVALVTGAARGIGRGIALELARAGAVVVVADRSTSSAKAVIEEIRAFGGESLSLELDVTDDESVRQCVANAIAHRARLDILVNNAGIFQSHLGLELTSEEFSHCLDVNLTGMWRMARSAIPHFRERRVGKMINIASVGGRLGVDFASGYCAAKAAVINLTQSLAALLGVDNINVNTVCPGSIATAMQEEIRSLKGALGSGVPERAQTPLPGPLTTADIGHAVVFLASDYAKNITGQALNVDCGSHMN